MNKELVFAMGKPKLPILVFHAGEVYGCKTFKEFYLRVVNIDKTDTFNIYDAYGKEFSWIEIRRQLYISPCICN